MYRFFFSFSLIFFISLQASAYEGEQGQPPFRRSRALGEQIQVERIAYFTEKIGLSSEEAQVFWPIYNEMDRRRSALFEEKASILQSFMRGTNNLTDRQINERLNRLATINQQEGALHGEYDAKFRKALSPQKVMNLYVAEMGFRNYLLQTMRDRREGR